MGNCGGENRGEDGGMMRQLEARHSSTAATTATTIRKMEVADRLLQLPLENELNMLSQRGGASLRSTVFLLQLVKLSWYAPVQLTEQKPVDHCEYPLAHAPPTTSV